MITSSVKFHPKQTFTDNNIATSRRTDDGMRIRTEIIQNSRGEDKKNNLISVTPHAGEAIELLSKNRDRFSDLKHLNLILTNTCNLTCSYCYEQHNRDYGRFTTDSLLRIHQFLVAANDEEGKLMQFFGGEPMIHKELILDFLRTHAEYLQNNSQSVRISMITNGTLLTPEFIDEYFSYEFTSMSISLDTDDVETDHREITQADVDHIYEMLRRIPQARKNNTQVSVRCTISRETTPNLKKFATKLYEAGLRAIVIHPLTMSATNGNVKWPDEEWDALHETMTYLLTNLPKFAVHFSEGVGAKKAGNCMVGSDMIAVDASGDFAGCYFFTNQKDGLRDTILGNIFDNTVYTDRYKKFQEEYNRLFEHPQCQACDLKGFCYQCPAGNLHTGDKQMFRPDDMCQQIVSLFIDLQADLSAKLFYKKYEEIMEAVRTTGVERVSKKMVGHLMYRCITNHHLPVGVLDDHLDTLPPPNVMLRHFANLLIADITQLPPWEEVLPFITGDAMDAREFYVFMLDRANIPSTRARADTTPLTPERTAFYYALIHLIVLNPKGDALEKSRKIVQL